MNARGKGIAKVGQLLNSKLLDEKQETVARKYQMHLTRPIKRPAERECFWQDYHADGFEFVARKYLRYGEKYRILMFIYNLLNRLKNKRLVQKVGNWIFY